MPRKDLAEEKERGGEARGENSNGAQVKAVGILAAQRGGGGRGFP